jgi:hypothetical protein
MYNNVMSISSSSSSQSIEFSDDTEQVLIESMESQIDILQDEVKRLHEIIDKLNKKVKTFESIVKSDLISKVFKYL